MQPTSPMTEVPRVREGLPWVRFVVVALFVALDLWSKSAVFAALPEMELTYDGHGHARAPILGDWLAMMLSTNEGSAFGMLKDWPHALVGMRILAIVVLVVLVARTRREHRVMLWALVLVLAGAAGNLHDNLFLDDPNDGHPFGLVRDWIDVYFTGLDRHFPTFNVADSCISVGAVLLLLSGFGGAEDEPEETRPDAGAGAEGDGTK
jgi:signal peptidase II